MDDIRECYRILDLEPGASFEEIKRSYRELVRVWHPDRFGNDAKLRAKAEEKLKRINLAYERLCKEAQEAETIAAPECPSAETNSTEDDQNANTTADAGSGAPPTAMSHQKNDLWTRWVVAAAVAVILVVFWIAARTTSTDAKHANQQPVGGYSKRGEDENKRNTKAIPQLTEAQNPDAELVVAWRALREKNDVAAVEAAKMLFQSVRRHRDPNIAYQGVAGLAAIASIEASGGVPVPVSLYPASSHPRLDGVWRKDGLLGFMHNIPSKDESGPWGFIDRSGNFVIPATWDIVSDFSEGLARVKRKSNEGFIDKTGRLVIPATWSLAGDFSEGLASVLLEDKLGFIDRTGNLVIPAIWDLASDFSEGLACVKRNSKKGFIDRSGNLVIPTTWEFAGSFNEGLAHVQQNGRWGFIDRSGKLVIPATWDWAGSFSEGLAVVRQNGKHGFIDRTGKVRIPVMWKDAEFFNEGRANVQQNEKKGGFIDRSGKLVIPATWDWPQPFSEGLAEVNQNNKRGFIDHSGTLVIPAVWDYAESFSGGIVAVYQRLETADGSGTGNSTPARMLYMDKEGRAIWSSDGKGIGEIARPLEPNDTKANSQKPIYGSDGKLDLMKTMPTVGTLKLGPATGAPLTITKAIPNLTEPTTTSASKEKPRTYRPAKNDVRWCLNRKEGRDVIDVDQGAKGSLEIGNGTKNAALVKLIDTFVNRKVCVCIILPKSSLKIEHVPDGSYRLEFSLGDEIITGTEKLWQPSVYSRFADPMSFSTRKDALGINYMVLRVTLHGVEGGTAKTISISPEEFDRY